MCIYLLQQAKGQVSIIYRTQNVSKLIDQHQLTPQQIEKIKLIAEIKTYAEKYIGLKETNNYTTFYDQQGKPILWMLTACEPYSFKENTWQFPLLGQVSYKGFFDQDLAIYEANLLKLQNKDVDLGKVSAWSTLGILKDPILSSMLDDDVGELAELIIHELTHATLYFESNVDFNENFASFIGQQGALNFLAFKFGKTSVEMKQFVCDMREQEILKKFLLQKKDSLNYLYQSFDKSMEVNAMEKLKQLKLDEIIRQLYLLPVFNWKTKIKIAQRIKISKNAYFMSYNRYDAQYNNLLKLYKAQGGNLKSFVKYAVKNPQMANSMGLHEISVP